MKQNSNWWIQNDKKKNKKKKNERSSLVDMHLDTYLLCRGFGPVLTFLLSLPKISFSPSTFPKKPDPLILLFEAAGAALKLLLDLWLFWLLASTQQHGEMVICKCRSMVNSRSEKQAANFWSFFSPICFLLLPNI